MPGSGPRKIPVVFYRTLGGAEVVRDWLRSLDDADRQAVGLDLMRVQYRWPVGMPLCRALGDGLWEVRTSLPSNRIARVLFRAFPDKIDHILSWRGMQRIRIGRSWSETRRWPRINYRRYKPLA